MLDSSILWPHKHTIGRPESSYYDDMDPGMARFGPVYGDDSKANRNAKDSAWKHILHKSEADAERDFMRSIADIEQKAWDTYHSSVVQKLKLRSEFRVMMLRDGCFFLQLALHILGGGELLEYSKQNPYFGRYEDSSFWIPTLFYVGNQIPYSVIEALMKQTFFQRVIKEGIQRGTWRRLPNTLEKLALYRLVVEPQLKRLRQPKTIFRGRTSSHQFRDREAPPDILYALHSLLLGPIDNDPDYPEIKDFLDLEAGIDDRDIKFPSARELWRKGIRLKKTHGGITNIHFRDFVFRAYLFVPPLAINCYTRDILKSLTSYEGYRFNDNNREVTAYLRLIRDLAPTYKDFIILQRSGIIQVNDQNSKNTILPFLNNLVQLNDCNFSLNFRQTRYRITDYGAPWRHINLFLGLITLFQLIFAILPYFVPTKSK